MRLLKRYACEDCGVPCERKRDPDDPLICLECGVRRAAAQNMAVAAAKAAGWPAGGPYNREQFAAPMRARWRAWGVRGAR